MNYIQANQYPVYANSSLLNVHTRFAHSCRPILLYFCTFAQPEHLNAAFYCKINISTWPIVDLMDFLIFKCSFSTIVYPFFNTFRLVMSYFHTLLDIHCWVLALSFFILIIIFFNDNFKLLFDRRCPPFLQLFYNQHQLKVPIKSLKIFINV